MVHPHTSTATAIRRGDVPRPPVCLRGARRGPWQSMGLTAWPYVCSPCRWVGKGHPTPHHTRCLLLPHCPIGLDETPGEFSAAPQGVFIES